MKRSLLMLALVLVALPVIAGENMQQVRKIGEEVTLAAPLRASGFASPVAEEPELAWRIELRHPDAEYVAPHFARFALPADAYLIVSSPDGARSWRYTADDNKRLEVSPEGFWGIHIYGEVAVVELYARGRIAPNAVVIDRYARGYRAWEMPDGEKPRDGRDPVATAICGSDDSQWARCYQSSQPTAYSKSRAVARLLINGSGACTGWLVGSEGHVMTNEHCIGTATDAANTNFEFMAEGGACTTDCASWGACPGTVVATSSTAVKINATYDYALVKLPTNPTGTYGYLQMRSSGATLNERIYIPQHPAHWGKKIAMTAGGANAKIDSLSAAACSGGTSDLGYAADTQGGSSGSPVIAYSDNLVVGLHHCGSCPNRAVPIQSVISNLGTSVPANAVVGGTPPPPSTCTTYTGTLSAGQSQYQPNNSYYYSSVSGSHTGKLTGPSTADFDLYLQKWNGSAWTSVASGTGSTSTENVSYSGTSGYYRWRVYAYSGSGSYSLCTTKP